jgi:hypothetical protein
MHLLVLRNMNALTSSISIEADIFCYLLNLYPDAIRIRGGDNGISPYYFAVTSKMSVYFIRYLLNAERTIELEKRCKLNYAARREAMFLSYRAVSSTKQPSILIQLRHQNLDLLVKCNVKCKILLVSFAYCASLTAPIHLPIAGR